MACFPAYMGGLIAGVRIWLNFKELSWKPWHTDSAFSRRPLGTMRTGFCHAVVSGEVWTSRGKTGRRLSKTENIAQQAQTIGAGSREKSRLALTPQRNLKIRVGIPYYSQSRHNPSSIQYRPSRSIAKPPVHVNKKIRRLLFMIEISLDEIVWWRKK